MRKLIRLNANERQKGPFWLKNQSLTLIRLNAIKKRVISVQKRTTGLRPDEIKSEGAGPLLMVLPACHILKGYIKSAAEEDRLLARGALWERGVDLAELHLCIAPGATVNPSARTVTCFRHYGPPKVMRDSDSYCKGDRRRDQKKCAPPHTGHSGSSSSSLISSMSYPQYVQRYTPMPGLSPLFKSHFPPKDNLTLSYTHRGWLAN